MILSRDRNVANVQVTENPAAPGFYVDVLFVEDASQPYIVTMRGLLARFPMDNGDANVEVVEWPEGERATTLSPRGQPAPELPPQFQSLVDVYKTLQDKKRLKAKKKEKTIFDHLLDDDSD